MSSAYARRLHRAGDGEVSRPEAHAVHARRSGSDRLDIVDALRRLQDGVDQDRLFELMPRLELREQLVEVVDVPWTIDLRQHDDVELVPDRRNDIGDVIERPGRVERIDAGP